MRHKKCELLRAIEWALWQEALQEKIVQQQRNRLDRKNRKNARELDRRGML